MFGSSEGFVSTKDSGIVIPKVLTILCPGRSSAHGVWLTERNILQISNQQLGILINWENYYLLKIGESSTYLIIPGSSVYLGLIHLPLGLNNSLYKFNPESPEQFLMWL